MHWTLIDYGESGFYGHFHHFEVERQDGAMPSTVPTFGKREIPLAYADKAAAEQAAFELNQRETARWHRYLNA